ncbi:MAG: ABC transporter ATP-binding protein [Propionibacterium sp.]|nr:ABC transporter ATP-binding protein [Propionibacterium sp.]
MISDLHIRGLSKSFGATHVLDDVSLTLPAGTVTSVIGPSGSGKSTLLHILTGSLAPDAGEVVGPDDASSPFAYMPQHDALLPWRRVIDNAALGLVMAGMPARRARAKAGGLFDAFGIDGSQQLWPRQLSGGMRQRVALLRTVVQDKPILLLDEPFGALDAITREQLQRWLLGIWEQHRWTMLLITHDIREAVRLSDRVVVLSPKPARIVGGVDVSRDIPRGEGFVLAPEVHELEHTLLQMLGGPC